MVAGLRGSSLRNSGFHLSDQIASDVGALGEDAAAESSEDRDQRRSESESHEGVDDDAALRIELTLEQSVVGGDSEQSESGDEETGDRSGAEGDFESVVETHRRGLSGSGVGSHRNVHADESRRPGKNRSESESRCDVESEDREDDREDDRSGDRDRLVLPSQIRLSAFLHRGGDAFHGVVSGVRLENRGGGDRAVGDRQQAAQKNRKHQRRSGHESVRGP